MRDALKQLGERAVQMREVIHSEETAKNALVIPFLKILGYDVSNPFEVQAEYYADVQNKKIKERLDYAIMKDGKPVILIECKHISKDLSRHGDQLFRYYSVIEGKKIAILTNGYEYQLFTDTDKENLKDEKPFLVFNITNIKDSQFEEIAKLQKSALDMDSLVNSANVLKYTSEIRDLIYDELVEPSEEFIKWIALQINRNNATQKRREFFEPLVKSSVKQVVDDIRSEYLDMLKSKAQEKEPEEADNGGIVTTEEEIEGFNIVKAIVCVAIHTSRIKYKDTLSYLGINIDDSIYKTFCRIYLGKQRAKLGIIKKEKKKLLCHI